MRVDHKMNDDLPWTIKNTKPKLTFFVTKAKITYRISANSFRRNFSFFFLFDLEVVGNSYSCCKQYNNMNFCCGNCSRMEVIP